jgi:transposase
VPKQHSSGGKDRLGSISKQGDRYLRGLFVAGALAIIRPSPFFVPAVPLHLLHRHPLPSLSRLLLLAH